MSAEIIPLGDFSRTGWMSGEARCMACGHEWVAVAKAGTTYLECPKCTSTKGFHRHAAMVPDGDERWVCKCGCDVFYMSRASTRCVNCAAPQVLP